jgi:fatty acid desaturase
MIISVKKKVMLTTLFAIVYVLLCLFGAWLVGGGIVASILSGLLAMPFGWMIQQTWSDDE